MSINENFFRMSSIKAPMAQLNLGNTSPNSKGEKRVSASKRWCFTYNNPIEEWKKEMAPGLEGCHWVCGEEVGEQGTYHLQGYVEFPVKVRPVKYKGFPEEIHWEKCKGDRKQNVNYCTKDGIVHGNIKALRLPICPDIYGWQSEIMEKLECEPDDRSIHWIWSREGGVGKSTFCKYLCMKENALICSGKAGDMKYMIAQYEEKNGEGPRIVVFDVPRSMRNYLSYTGIEEIKNGLFASTKYESRMCIVAHPHVVVCANFPPDLQDVEMSHDRFVVTRIEGVPPLGLAADSPASGSLASQLKDL